MEDKTVFKVVTTDTETKRKHQYSVKGDCHYDTYQYNSGYRVAVIVDEYGHVLAVSSPITHIFAPDGTEIR